jgi:hypothetical protein
MLSTLERCIIERTKCVLYCVYDVLAVREDLFSLLLSIIAFSPRFCTVFYLHVSKRLRCELISWRYEGFHMPCSSRGIFQKFNQTCFWCFRSYPACGGHFKNIACNIHFMIYFIDEQFYVISVAIACWDSEGS